MSLKYYIFLTKFNVQNLKTKSQITEHPTMLRHHVLFFRKDNEEPSDGEEGRKMGRRFIFRYSRTLVFHRENVHVVYSQHLTSGPFRCLASCTQIT